MNYTKSYRTKVITEEGTTYMTEYMLKDDAALDEIDTENLAIGSLAFSTSGTLFMYDGTEWVEV